MERKKASRITLLLCILLVAAICGALFFAWRILQTKRAYKQAENTYEEIAQKVVTADEPDRIPEGSQAGDTAAEHSRVNWEALQALAPGAVAWLSCGDVISYPVMQGEDNAFYLHHLADGTYSFAGSLFVDYRSAGDFTGRNTVIYGHNMRDSTMFSFLENYREQAYFDEHSTMRLDTPDGSYTLALLAGYVQDIDASYEIPTDFLSEEETRRFVEQAQQRSTFVSEQGFEAGDKIVTLVSCTSSSRDTERYFVICRLVGLK